MKPILLVDDDRELCQLLVEYMNLENFDVDVAHDGQQALAMALARPYAVIVLDVMMPRLNGFDTLRELRRESNTPVLMMSARGEEIDRIVGFEMGADDYLPKPCSPRELVARIRAIIRRVALEAPVAAGVAEVDRLVSGDLVMQHSTRSVTRLGVPLELTHTEFNLLKALMTDQGVLVSKEVLMQTAMNRKLGPFDRSLDMHISNLRRKIGPHPDGRPRIKTVRGTGYLFISDGQAEDA